jgi:excisionase family DNA binding protein
LTGHDTLGLSKIQRVIQVSYNVSVQEAAKMLEVSERTIYRYIESDKLEAKKVLLEGQKRWLIDDRSVHKRLEKVEEGVSTVKLKEPEIQALYNRLDRLERLLRRMQEERSESPFKRFLRLFK